MPRERTASVSSEEIPANSHVNDDDDDTAGSYESSNDVSSSSSSPSSPSSERRVSACPQLGQRRRKPSWKLRAQLWLYEKAIIFQMIAMVSMEPLFNKLGGIQKEEEDLDGGYMRGEAHYNHPG